MASTVDDQTILRADTTEEYLANAAFIAQRCPPGNPEGYTYTLFSGQKRIVIIRARTGWTIPTLPQ